MTTSAPLARRASAEAVGTAVLVAVVVGSGIQATELTSDAGLQLLADCLATVLGLAVLITLLGPVSGAHFNPAVTAAAWWTGRRDRTGPGLAEAGIYAASQTAGAIAGAVLANAMFAEPLVAWSGRHRSAPHLWLAEVVATAGLVMLVSGLSRTGRDRAAAPAVAAWIGAAYWATSSTSFANPAVTVGRMFSDTFAGIAPVSAPGFVAAQLVGTGVGLALVATVFGRAGGPRSAASAAVAQGDPETAVPVR